MHLKYSGNERHYHCKEWSNNERSSTITSANTWFWLGNILANYSLEVIHSTLLVFGFVGLKKKGYTFIDTFCKINKIILPFWKQQLELQPMGSGIHVFVHRISSTIDFHRWCWHTEKCFPNCWHGYLWRRIFLDTHCLGSSFLLSLSRWWSQLPRKF